MLHCCSHQAKESSVQKQTLRFPLRKQSGPYLGRLGGSLLQHRLIFRLGKPPVPMHLLLRPPTHPDELETSLRGTQQAQPRVAMDGYLRQGEKRRRVLLPPAPHHHHHCFFAVSWPDLSPYFCSGMAESTQLHAPISALWRSS